jgi:uncharacterized protein (TIGR00661 family)
MGNFTRAGDKPKILVAPLDWGLGHATRCIPIIYELIKFSCEVIIAAEGDQERLLKDEFPGLRFVRLEGYRIRYASGRRSNKLVIAMQIPKIIMKIRSEKKWLDKLIASEKPDAIISDNRYGLYTKQIPSIFITHQIHIRSGLGKFIDGLIEQINHGFIRKFSACWIPDNADRGSLAGALSNPSSIRGVETLMLGPITRFKPCNNKTEGFVLVILTGPEPQRSILEERLMELAKFMNETIIMVRGLPREKKLAPTPPNVRAYNHATSDELNRLICGAEWVISRSGYTTIMDLMLLGKKSVLIPTPGQAEQEWLAGWLFQNQWAFTIHQEELSAAKLVEARTFDFKAFEASQNQGLQHALCSLISVLKQNQE